MIWPTAAAEVELELFSTTGGWAIYIHITEGTIEGYGDTGLGGAAANCVLARVYCWLDKSYKVSLSTRKQGNTHMPQ